MVSLIAAGSSRDDSGMPFPRRRHRPVLILTAALAAVSMVIWVVALTKSDDDVVAMNCNSPTRAGTATADTPAPAPLGTRKSPSMLQEVEPAALSSTKISVYNANGERGQAAHVAAQLSDLGFATAAGIQVGNDPVYVDQNMQCSSQIRFGESGRSAAAAVQLVAPCSELIEDSRGDESVDLALGTVFSDIRPNTDAQEVLRSLKDPAPGVKPAPLDSNLLEAARKAKC